MNNSIYDPTEAIEIRFYQVFNERSYQLLANPIDNCVRYTLKRVTAGAPSECLSNLNGDSDVILPLKSYNGWQSDVIKWVTTLSNGGVRMYEIENIL